MNHDRIKNDPARFQFYFKCQKFNGSSLISLVKIKKNIFGEIQKIEDKLYSSPGGLNYASIHRHRHSSVYQTLTRFFLSIFIFHLKFLGDFLEEMTTIEKIEIERERKAMYIMPFHIYFYS